MTFPKCVYKRGTGKAVDDNGLFEAESIVVNSAEELSALPGEWCDNPAEAAAGTSKKEADALPDLAAKFKKGK